MLIGAQAFQTTPVKHAPAIRAGADAASLARLGQAADRHHARFDPQCGAGGGRACRRQGRHVKMAAIAALPQQGVLYHGLE